MAFRHLFIGKGLETEIVTLRQQVKTAEENLTVERDKRLSDTKLWLDKLAHEQETWERRLTSKEDLWKALLAKADAKIDDLERRMLTMAGVPDYNYKDLEPQVAQETVAAAQPPIRPGIKSFEQDLEREEREWREVQEYWKQGVASLDSEQE